MLQFVKSSLQLVQLPTRKLPLLFCLDLACFDFVCGLQKRNEHMAQYDEVDAPLLLQVASVANRR